MRREQGVVVGNVYDKYRSRNPIARALMEGFLRHASELFARCPSGRVVEVGSGEGHLIAHLRRLQPETRMLGVELSKELAREAGREHGDPRTAFAAGSAYHLPLRDGALDGALCCETLEHLDRPVVALAELRRVLRSGGMALLSVPREPLWRVLNLARGKYLTALGNTPGHVGHYSARGFARLVEEAGFRVLERRQPLPWTLLLVER